MTRRSALRSFLSAALLAPTAGCTVASATRSPGVPTAVPLRYGPDPSQVLDLHLPAGTSRSLPVVVVIHGGYWSDAYGKDLGDPLAVDLANRGYAAVNIEYRRLGSGGGWPATLTDVAAAIDSLDTVVRPAAHDRLDLTRVVALGHSAGGQLAVWAAARPGFPSSAPGSGPKVRLRAAISQAGVVDLITGAPTSSSAGERCRRCSAALRRRSPSGTRWRPRPNESRSGCRFRWCTGTLTASCRSSKASAMPPRPRQPATKSLS
nr:alpha/beta hydrolase [Fodinicola feengrottensis]